MCSGFLVSLLRGFGIPVSRLLRAEGLEGAVIALQLLAAEGLDLVLTQFLSGNHITEQMAQPILRLRMALFRGSRIPVNGLRAALDHAAGVLIHLAQLELCVRMTHLRRREEALPRRRPILFGAMAIAFIKQSVCLFHALGRTFFLLLFSKAEQCHICHSLFVLSVSCNLRRYPPYPDTCIRFRRCGSFCPAGHHPAGGRRCGRCARHPPA